MLLAEEAVINKHRESPVRQRIARKPLRSKQQLGRGDTYVLLGVAGVISAFNVLRVNRVNGRGRLTAKWQFGRRGGANL